MKKFLIILILPIICIFLGGCEPGEVQKRLVVHALGIDPCAKGYEVSYQVFTGKAPDGAPVDADESTVATLLAQGRTLFETEESLRLQTGKEIFLGDAELIVINRDLKSDGLSEFLEYFKKSDIYLGVNVIFCNGRAAEVIGSKLKQGSATAILLRGAISEAVGKGRALSSRIIELSNALKSDGEAMAIPVLTLKADKDEGDGMTLADTELGTFSSLIITPSGAGSEIDENAVMGISLLKGKMKKTAVTVKLPSGAASVSINNMKIKRNIKIENGLPTVTVKIGGIYDIEYSPDGASEEEAVKAAEQELIYLCSAGYRYIGEGDLFGIKKLLYRYESDYAERLGEEISEIIPKTSFSVEARLQKY